jgi:hypothetical protein
VRNAIIFKVDLDGGDKPLSATKLVATFTLTASHKNTQDLTALGRQGTRSGRPGHAVLLRAGQPGGPLGQEQGGETVFVVGHSAE